MPQRKGSSRRAEIPQEVLDSLNDGTLETATLAEGLAIDFQKLLATVAPELEATELETIQAGEGITRRMLAVGELLSEKFGLKELARFVEHRSDTVRGWAAYLIAATPKLSLKQRLQRLRPLADDAHFGVREWAWLALREAIEREIETAIGLLIPWVSERSANLRRFATEATRPRGVWCRQIARLKTNPELGLPLLEPLRADPSKYVRDSVANWLNDAGKSQPEWVQELCTRWEEESPTPETKQIVARARRNL